MPRHKSAKSDKKSKPDKQRKKNKAHKSGKKGKSGKSEKKWKGGKDLLRSHRVLDVPLQEVSGICLRRERGGQMALVAVGDRAATVAWISLPESDADALDWKTTNVGKFAGSALPDDDPQIEAICADGAGRVLLLQEAPARAELVDFAGSRTLASIELRVTGSSDVARSWSDPDGSRGEGVIFLPGGHLLVAKEKEPAALIEFGPKGSTSLGWKRGGALGDGDSWPIREGSHRFVPLAVWLPDDALANTCEDFSDIDIGPDGRLYLLSDQSATIARLAKLPPGGGAASLETAWRLKDVAGKPEGLAFTAEGRAVVALDTRQARKNLILLDPPIAT